MVAMMALLALTIAADDILLFSKELGTTNSFCLVTKHWLNIHFFYQKSTIASYIVVVCQVVWQYEENLESATNRKHSFTEQQQMKCQECIEYESSY